MWHVETDYFALIIFIIMLIKNRILKRERNFQDNVFYYVLIASLFNVVIDIISSTAMNDVTNWWIYQLTMTAYILTMPLLASAWVCYTVVLIDKDKDTAILQREIAVIMAPYVGYAILGLSNPFTGLFFHLTSDIQYSRGILFFPLGVGFIMFYSVAGIIIVFARRKKIQVRENVMLLSMFFCSTAVSIWIQLANPGWLIINACYAVVYVWCDMTIEEQRRRELMERIQRQNEELESALQKAEAATKSKTMFLSNMSHDMRTPMNAIIGLSNLAMDVQSVDELKEEMIKINLSGKQLLALINDTLDVSRIENGKLTMNREYVMSSQLLMEGVASTKVVAEQKGVHFRLEKDGFIDAALYVDAVKITKLFTNLLSNAVKFTPPGGEVVFFIRRTGEKNGVAYYCMGVRDTGIGMSKEYLKHIFEPFSQERTDRATNSTGTGLGMTIVKEFADFLGAKITIESELGKGTTVTVWIGYQLADKTPAELQKETCTISSGTHRILVAEDHPLNAEIVRKLLEKQGYQVDHASNGKECVLKFTRSTPGYYGMILMDIRMPEMDGLEATRFIRHYERADAATIPIIAMTANAFEQDMKECLDAGMNEHLSKPVEPEKMYAALRKYLDVGAI